MATRLDKEVTIIIMAHGPKNPGYRYYYHYHHHCCCHCTTTITTSSR